MPGRPRKPTKLLEIQGTRRNDRHGKRSDATLQNEVPEPPNWLGAEARAEWDRLTGHSQYRRALTLIDRGMLAVYCDLWGRYVEGVGAEKRLTPTETMVLVNLAAKLGLNPSDRAKISMPAPEKPQSPWEALKNTAT